MVIFKNYLMRESRVLPLVQKKRLFSLNMEI